MGWDYAQSWQGSNMTFMGNNAVEFYNYMYQQGWTLNAIAGALGNITKESAINPWQKEMVSNFDPNVHGGGLVGWTPYNALYRYCEAHGLNYLNGDDQCSIIDSGVAVQGGSAWGNSYDPNAPSVVPPVTWSQFKTSTLAVETLSDYWMYYYEKPAYSASQSSKQERREWSLKWYWYIIGYDPDIPHPDPDPTPEPDPDPPPSPNPPLPTSPPERVGMPIYMMIRRFI